MTKTRFITLTVIIVFMSWVSATASARVMPFAYQTHRGMEPQLPDSAPFMGTASFCDPVEISIAVASNAFEKDHPLAQGETYKTKKPVRWQIIRQYSRLPFDAVPFAVINVGSRSEGYFDLTGDYHFGNPGEEELARLLLEYDYFVEVVFSVYDPAGRLVEDVAGVYQVNARSHDLVTDPAVHLQRLVHLFRNESALSVHEAYSVQLAGNSLSKVERYGDFSGLFTMCEFIEKRCEALGRTPLYSNSDLYAYMALLNALDEGLNLYMFEVKSSSVDPLIVKQCRAAIRKVQALRDLVAEIANR